MKTHDGCTTLELRRRFAAEAFALSAKYDAAISSWFARQLNPSQSTDVIVTRPYLPVRELKYGCNPHQKPAGLYRHLGLGLPFRIVHGNPGYINLCDALNSWMLVKEARQALGVVAAASFKHVSPAGAAIAVPLTEAEKRAYEVGEKEPRGAALAYLRARNADPMSSFGDFAAISDVVDVETAEFLATVVSDGVIAAGFEPAALEILKKKKKGAFIVLQGEAEFAMPEMEFRELHGCVLAQRHNDVVPSREQMRNVVTAKKEIPDAAMNDLVLGNICLKYTQSNSVAYARNGQMIGVGAGQQSRVDCVKLAVGKAASLSHIGAQGGAVVPAAAPEGARPQVPAGREEAGPRQRTRAVHRGRLHPRGVRAVEDALRGGAAAPLAAGEGRLPAHARRRLALLRRLLPLPRQHRPGLQVRSQVRLAARRVHPGRGRHRCRRLLRHDHGAHRTAPLPPLRRQ